MLKMVDGTGIIGVDMICPLGVSTPQPPNYDRVELEGAGILVLPNSLDAPLERLELIGNSVQGENPALDNPQEIKSVGRKSKNLFDAKQLQGIPGFGVDGNEITQSAYNISTGKTLKQLCPAITPGTYFLSASNNEFTGLFGLTKPFYKNKSMEITEEDLNRIVALVGATNKTIKFTLQLEKGDKATDYEPYSDKHFVDLKVTGKNLLSNKSADWMIGKKTSWSANPEYPIDANVPDISNALFFMNVKPSTKYTFVNKENDKLWVNRIIERDGKKGVRNHALYQNESQNYNKYTFITKDRTTSIIFQIKKVDNTELLSTDIESIKIMLVEGEADENVPYEPYTEQSMQIALNEPLRGIGEYKDTITKDGVARRIKRIVFDENTPFKEYNAPVQVKTTSFISGTTIKDATGETGIEVMSDRFKAKDRGFDRYDEECITLLGKSIFVRFNKDKNINTAEALTEWLKQNPLTVDYVLAEPVTEPLSESVQAQFAALHSENGVTHVFVDSGEVPCGIKLTYRKEI